MSGTAGFKNFNTPVLKQMGFKLLLAIVGFMLILFGAGNMALAIIGEPIKAQVTSIEPVLILHDDESTRNPSRYQIDYRFSVDGSSYSGSVTRVFAGGSQMRSTIPVRYLPAWPPVNAEDRPVDPTGPVLLGAGILLLLFSFRRANSPQH